MRSMVPHNMLGGNFVVLPPADVLMPHAENQDSRKQGLKAEAKMLGTVQIVSSVMVMVLGLLIACSPFPHQFSSLIVTLVKSGYPFVGAKCFIVSGLLSVIMEKRTNKHMAWASLATNLLSLVTAFVGFVLITFHMAEVLVAQGQCELDVVPTQPSGSSFYSSGSTTPKCAFASSILLGVLSVMLLFTVLEFCIAIPTSLLWWRRARLGVPGDVRFRTQNEMITINVLPETFADPDPVSAQLATLVEREKEGKRERE
nr:PREDICTED: membrane-spanning 4-domains subfamily A member 6C-like isoform X2 [Rhinolophus sinicus]XP_019611154.1 PREDICTED: membrane-spanning 4-domains subfamily A member 6C-like isoform X2 [Rhinolophus sinicus]XP_019611155.1 PREDICTED: membrane-spanning 4-domains subfamily A member 6C-like isoform X2 [Rhinolophus sinicus]XP_019611156.1 PREDICTED: membrane-spanning 4-domains subfamily A member 6C-like isoform X2 [Rhinolophus sinicus]XP_019611157.1 PREDICTED: membrane-spanning 4-domains subfa